MKLKIVAILALLFVAACSPTITSGKIVEKKFTPEDSYWTSQCMAYDSTTGSCTFRVPIEQTSPERFEIVIEGPDEEGKTVRSRLRVPSDEYNRCRTGDSYPECNLQ